MSWLSQNHKLAAKEGTLPKFGTRGRDEYIDDVHFEVVKKLVTILRKKFPEWDHLMLEDVVSSLTAKIPDFKMFADGSFEVGDRSQKSLNN